jgi:hypothetical protein
MSRFAGASMALVAVSLVGTAAFASGHVPGLDRFRAIAASATRPTSADKPDPAIPPHSFYFARAEYTGDGQFPHWKDWETDFPKADQQFLSVLKRLATLDAYDHGVPVRLDDPELRRFPYVYAVEVGHMDLSDSEAAALRDYLRAGGFLVVDDFWGTEEWTSFERQMTKVFPDRPIVDIPSDHALFHSYYDIDEVVQVPNMGQATAISQGVPGATTYESDGYVPTVRGIFDEKGRLMVAINWNTDLGDGWEWAELPTYPLQYSTYAMQIGVNTIVYALSH